MTMSDFPMAGLLTWIVTGLAAGALARSLLPARHRCGWLAALAVAALGALAGGLAATALGFGGAGALSLPAAVIAALAAALAVLVLALLRSFRPPATS